MKTVTATTGCVITGEGVGRSVIGTVGVGVGTRGRRRPGGRRLLLRPVSCGVTGPVPGWRGNRAHRGSDFAGTRADGRGGSHARVSCIPPGVCASGNVTAETDENRAVGFGAVMVPAATAVAAIGPRAKKRSGMKYFRIDRFVPHG